MNSTETPQRFRVYYSFQGSGHERIQRTMTVPVRSRERAIAVAEAKFARMIREGSVSATTAIIWKVVPE